MAPIALAFAPGPAAAIALATLALALLAWALFHDRSRGRPRCPRCWYDLSAQVFSPPHSLPATCPECGKVITQPRRLHRTRRRWRIALATLPLFIVAYELPRIPAIRSRGPVAAIPTTALLLLAPLDHTDVFTDRHNPVLNPSPLLEEFKRRTAWPWQYTLWHARLELHARRNDLHEIPDGTRRAHRRLRETPIDVRPDASALETLHDIAESASLSLTIQPPLTAERPGIPLFAGFETRGTFLALDLIPLVCWSIETGSHPSVVRPTYDLTPTALVIADRRSLMDRTVVRFYDLRPLVHVATRWTYDSPPSRVEPTGSSRVIIFDGGPHTHTYDTHDAFNDIVEAIETFVAFNTWRDSGGPIGSVHSYDDRTLIIRTLPRIHIEVERLLDTLAHPLPLPDAEPPDTHPAAKRTVAYDLRPILRLLPPGERTEQAQWDIIERMMTEVDPAGWRDNAGDTSTYLTLGPTLIIKTTPIVHARTIDFLNRLHEQPHPSPE